MSDDFHGCTDVCVKTCQLKTQKVFKKKKLTDYQVYQSCICSFMIKKKLVVLLNDYHSQKVHDTSSNLRMTKIKDKDVFT